MSLMTAEWYDRVMVEPDSPAMLPLEDSPWLPVYTEAAKGLHGNEELVDLGCGTGRFIKLLYQRGHYGRIVGVDWSTTALQEAEEYAEPEHPDAPEPEWDLSDLSDWTPDAFRAGNTVFTCLEVLEHLEDDLGLVRRIPPGHTLILTVPNYDSESHLRVFRNPGDVWERYDHLLSFKRWSLVGTNRQAVHVCETQRRGDSW